MPVRPDDNPNVPEHHYQKASRSRPPNLVADCRFAACACSSRRRFSPCKELPARTLR